MHNTDEHDQLHDAWAVSPWSHGLKADDASKRLLLAHPREIATLVELAREFYWRMARVSFYSWTKELLGPQESYLRIAIDGRGPWDQWQLSVPYREEGALPTLAHGNRELMQSMLHAEHPTIANAIICRTFERGAYQRDSPIKGIHVLAPTFNEVERRSEARRYLSIVLRMFHNAWVYAQSRMDHPIPKELQSPYEPLLDLLDHPFRPCKVVLYNSVLGCTTLSLSVNASGVEDSHEPHFSEELFGS